jgi:hypothetical protein
MNCAQAGTVKFTAERSFGSLVVVGHFTYFGTTTLSGSTGLAPAAWTDAPRPSAATTRRAGFALVALFPLARMSY